MITDRLVGRCRVALGTLLLGVVTVVLSGCGGAADDKPPRFPTRGSVTYNGKPAADAVVTFHPLPLKDGDWQAVKPAGRVQADGSFQMHTYDAADGVPAGDYAVTVRWAVGRPPGPDQLGGRYNEPKRPVAKFTVAAGENTIPDIKLTGPAVGASAGKDDDPKTPYRDKKK